MGGNAERRRGHVPRNRPDVLPLIVGDPSAQTAIERVRSAEGIDQFVSYLRQVHFRKWLGYVPPLILSHPQPSKTLEDAMDQGLLTPDNFGSAMWNQSFTNYPGSVRNIRASFIPFDPHLAQTFQPFVHRLSAVPFRVEGDLYSETGAMEGTAARDYMLFVTHFEMQNVVPRRALDQAKRFYDPAELRAKKVLNMSTTLENPADVRRLIHTAYERVYQSRQTAKDVERRGREHPYPGGLPTLGKH